jgi:hypothetical protein
MKFFKKKLNSSGFSHIELGLVLIVIVGISAVGYWVVKHSNSANAANTYTTLTPIKGNGYVFTEQACITAQKGTSPNYIDTVTALISVGRRTGSGTKYNPLAYYKINGGTAVTKDNWTIGSTSTITFNLPASSSASTFLLGVEAKPGSTHQYSGSTRTIGSLTLCNPATKSAPTVSLSASPSTVKSGSTSILTWKTTNASTCTASNGWNGSEPTSGTFTTGDLNATSSYILSCTGIGGSASATATVTVSAPIATPVTTTKPVATTTTTTPPTTTTPVTTTAGSVWQPAQKIEWQWEIGHALNTTSAADMGTGITAYNGDTAPATNPSVYDIDAIENPASTVTALHALGDRAICYIEVGTAGNYYAASDEGIATTYYAQLQAAGDLGSKLSGYTEYFININSASTVSIMESMIQKQCAAKGFDGVETDLDETFGSNEGSTGFTITQANEETYLTTLANYMHSVGLAWIAKNLSDTGIQSFVSDMQPLAQGVVDEQANQYGTISLDNVFLNAKKPVFNAEYSPETLAQFCTYDNTNNINGVLFPVNLDGPRQICR